MSADESEQYLLNNIHTNIHATWSAGSLRPPSPRRRGRIAAGPMRRARGFTSSAARYLLAPIGRVESAAVGGLGPRRGTRATACGLLAPDGRLSTPGFTAAGMGAGGRAAPRAADPAREPICLWHAPWMAPWRTRLTPSWWAHLVAQREGCHRKGRRRLPELIPGPSSVARLRAIRSDFPRDGPQTRDAVHRPRAERASSPIGAAGHAPRGPPCPADSPAAPAAAPAPQRPPPPPPPSPPPPPPPPPLPPARRRRLSRHRAGMRAPPPQGGSPPRRSAGPRGRSRCRPPPPHTSPAQGRRATAGRPGAWLRGGPPRRWGRGGRSWRGGRKREGEGEGGREGGRERERISPPRFPLPPSEDSEIGIRERGGGGEREREREGGREGGKEGERGEGGREEREGE